MKIHHAIDQYLQWKKVYQLRSWTAYKPVLERLRGIGKDLENITQKDVSDFISTEMKKYKPSYVQFSVCVLRDFFNYHKTGINTYQIRHPRYTLPLIRYLTEDEFELIDNSLDEWNGYELQAKVIHRLLYDTGMRVSELCSILLSDIDIKNKCIKIITSKSKKYGFVMWSNRTHELLIRYLGFRLLQEGDYLFNMTTRNIERIIKKISERVGLIGVTPHKYRHGKAHKILKDGGHIDDVTFILRHSSPELTKQMYLRLDKDESEHIMEKYL